MTCRNRWVQKCVCLSLLMLVSTSCADALPRVKVVRLPDRGVQPRVAKDSDGTVHLVYFAGPYKAGNVYYAKWPANANRLSKPVQVNSKTNTAIALGNVRGPQIAVGENGRVHVVWNAAGGNALYYAHSLKAGGFSDQRNVMTHTVGIDGGSAVAADGKGDVMVVFHAIPHKGMNEANRKIWVAESKNNGQTFAPEKPVDPGLGACGCCGLAAGATRDGQLIVLYRRAQQRKHRGMELLRGRVNRQGMSAVRLDRWLLQACPLSTATVRVQNQSAVAAWERNGQVYWAKFDTNKGAGPIHPIAAPGRANDRKHPAIAVNAKGQTLLVWTEGTAWARGGTVQWAMFNGNGQTIGTGTCGRIPKWDFPAVFANGQGEFVVTY